MDGLFSYIELIDIKDMVLQKTVESHKQKETHIYKLHSLFRELLINFPISFSTRTILTIIFSLRSFGIKLLFRKPKNTPTSISGGSMSHKNSSNFNWYLIKKNDQF